MVEGPGVVVLRWKPWTWEEANAFLGDSPQVAVRVAPEGLSCPFSVRVRILTCFGRVNLRSWAAGGWRRLSRRRKITSCTSFEPESNQRPKDVYMLCIYSPPLYQLSYRRAHTRLCCVLPFWRNVKSQKAFFFFFKFYFIFKLYIIVLVLPNIKMNPLQVYMCSPSWTHLPPPSPYHPSGSSQCTSPTKGFKRLRVQHTLRWLEVPWQRAVHTPGIRGGQASRRSDFQNLSPGRHLLTHFLSLGLFLQREQDSSPLWPENWKEGEENGALLKPKWMRGWGGSRLAEESRGSYHLGRIRWGVLEECLSVAPSPYPNPYLPSGAGTSSPPPLNLDLTLLLPRTGLTFPHGEASWEVMGKGCRARRGDHILRYPEAWSCCGQSGDLAPLLCPQSRIPLARDGCSLM